MPDAVTPAPPTLRRQSRLRLLALVAALGLGGLSTAVYGMGWLGRNAAGDPACQTAVGLAAKLAPLARGEVAALTMAAKPLLLPDLAFQAGDGAPRKLSDWRGRTVLLNLWATWCVPCRKEMPALDRLQAKLGSDRFEVVAVNIDTRDPAKPRAFLKEAELSTLAYYSDANAKVFQDLKGVGRALGMPTSVIVDPQGCEIATIAGPAEWDSDDAVKLLEAAMGK